MMPTKALPYKYLALIYALLIFIVSAIPSLTPPNLGFVLQDKILHFIEYSLFSFLLFLAFFTSGRQFLKKNVFFLSCLIGMVYAVTDEIHQGFVSGRSREFFDFVADSLGIIMVQLCIWLYLKRKKNRQTCP
jgi:VanZ family protein